ncbi:MAG: response regulator, partial [Candidatus Marinimicrobia bacterium]|nr:response regulator [Candidatus Neomarinimicrobiota bacterium]
GKILLVNPGLAKMLEYDSPEGLQGRDISTLPHWRKYDRDKFLEEISKAGKVTNFQSVWVTKSGKELQVRENARVVHNEDGTICHYEGTVEDVTQQRQLEQQLIESQKMESLGHIAGGIAHDFNNVMASISGALGVLNTKIEDSELKRYVSMGLAGIERGQTVTNRMLTFTRSKDPEVKPVPVEQFFQDISEIVSHTLSKNIRVDLNIEGDGLHVLADYVQLEQAFINLCINAADAMPEGGNIHLYAKKASRDEHENIQDADGQEYILIRIRDTGKGMSEEVAERIFEPFYTTKERGQGTGLGLSVVYKIIQNHGGWIEVESFVNDGTTFTIGLPVATPTEQSAAKAESIHDIRGQGEHILVVDDEPQIRYLLSDQLEALGYNVTTSEDGMSALQIFKAKPEMYTLIITDFGLPGMNGQDLAKEIHSIDPAKKIIGITGYIIDENYELTHNGFLAILKKPFELDELMSLISKNINGQD